MRSRRCTSYAGGCTKTWAVPLDSDEQDRVFRTGNLERAKGTRMYSPSLDERVLIEARATSDTDAAGRVAS